MDDIFLRLIMGLQAQAIVESTSNGAEIAKVLTDYKYGVVLSDDEAQAKWDSWCVFGKANAVSLYNELIETGSLAEHDRHPHSQLAAVAA